MYHFMLQQPFQPFFVGLRIGTFRIPGRETLNFMFFVK
jgi:hypothetical protein